jgi:hypothetical protein
MAKNIYMLTDAWFVGSVSADLASNSGTHLIVRKRKVLFITNVTKFEAMNMSERCGRCHVILLQLHLNKYFNMKYLLLI